jgi:hypothetical protein
LPAFSLIPFKARQAFDRSGFAPALLPQLGNLTREATEGLFDPMPVRIPLLVHDSLIFMLGGFPSARIGWVNAKRSDVLGANQLCRK